jgi:hypothetical protein
MSRICPVYASYLLRYGTSMKHVREIHGACINLDIAVLVSAMPLPYFKRVQGKTVMTHPMDLEPALLRRNGTCTTIKASAIQLVIQSTNQLIQLVNSFN